MPAGGSLTTDTTGTAEVVINYALVAITALLRLLGVP